MINTILLAETTFPVGAIWWMAILSAYMLWASCRSTLWSWCLSLAHWLMPRSRPIGEEFEHPTEGKLLVKAQYGCTGCIFDLKRLCDKYACDFTDIHCGFCSSSRSDSKSIIFAKVYKTFSGRGDVVDPAELTSHHSHTKPNTHCPLHTITGLERALQDGYDGKEWIFAAFVTKLEHMQSHSTNIESIINTGSVPIITSLNPTREQLTIREERNMNDSDNDTEEVDDVLATPTQTINSCSHAEVCQDLREIWATDVCPTCPYYTKAMEEVILPDGVIALPFYAKKLPDDYELIESGYATAVTVQKGDMYFSQGSKTWTNYPSGDYGNKRQRVARRIMPEWMHIVDGLPTGETIVYDGWYFKKTSPTRLSTVGSEHEAAEKLIDGTWTSTNRSPVDFKKLVAGNYRKHTPE